MVVPLTGPSSLYKFKALLLPWAVRGLETLNLVGTAWHDGDTFNALVSAGRHDYAITHIRCAGYNAPELKTGQPGTDATEYARSLVETGQIVYLDSIQFIATDEEDDFGRMLAVVTLPDGRDLATWMIQTGHAAPVPIR